MRMQRAASGLLALLTGVAIAAGAQAQPEAHGRDVYSRLLLAADANADGVLTYDEMAAVAPIGPAAFDRLDRNGDGVLSAADFPPPAKDAPPHAVLTYLLTMADANGDGGVSLAEARAVLGQLGPRAFDLLDRNDDGVLTSDDIPSNRQLPDDALTLLKRLLRQADTNGDGAISLAEAQALVAQVTPAVFNRLDRDGDGLLTPADLPAAPPHDPLRRLINLLRVADANDDQAVTYAELTEVIPRFPQALFDRMDSNGDAVLTIEDLPEGVQQLKQLIDTLREADAAGNGDGAVTFDELQAEVPQLTQDQFNRLDRNGDGVITLDDLPRPDPGDRLARLLWLLKEADANGDGQVTLEELQATLPNFGERAFDFLDRNGDGVLSRADLPGWVPDGPLARLVRLLRLADADNNGEVTFDELQALVPDVTPEQFARLDRNGDGVLSRDDLPDFPPGPRARLLHLLKTADANGDHVVTFEELQAVVPNLTQEQFDRLDTNGDGVISIDDRPDPPVDPIKRLIRLLHEADADGNGEVTFEELQAVAPDVTAEQFARLDRNGDGVISRADLPEPLPDPRRRILEWLRNADTNDDQALSFEELQAVVPGITQERFDELDANGDGLLTVDDLPEGPLPRDRALRRAFLKRLIQADANRDGVLDLDEVADAFPEAPAELLDRIDTNDDQVISRAELRAALAYALGGDELVAPHDADGNGATNAVDVQRSINDVLGLVTDILPADVNEDGETNAIDVQGTINGVLGIG